MSDNIEDFPIGGTPEERRAFMAQYRRQTNAPRTSTPDQLTPKQIRQGLFDAQLLFNQIRLRTNRSPEERREWDRKQANVTEWEQRLADQNKQEARQQQIEGSSEYKLAAEHAQPFARMYGERAGEALKALEAGDVKEYWQAVSTLETEEWAKLDAKRSDAELNKLAADRDHANAELASTEAKHRLEQLP